VASEDFLQTARPNRKKAMVKLAEGQKIEALEGLV
jgi:ribosomal protein L23